VSVTVSAPSTVIDEEVIARLMGLELPPQPERHNAAVTAKAEKTILLNTLTPESWAQKKTVKLARAPRMKPGPGYG
jgi:hypothetical protein